MKITLRSPTSGAQYEPLALRSRQLTQNRVQPFNACAHRIALSSIQEFVSRLETCHGHRDRSGSSDDELGVHNKPLVHSFERRTGSVSLVLVAGHTMVHVRHAAPSC